MASQESGSNLQGSFATDSTFTAQAAPTVVATAPITTATSTQPILAWSDTLSGTTQASYQAVIESGTYATTPGSGTTVWNPGVVSSSVQSVMCGAVLNVGTTYRFFIQITNSDGQTSAWAYSTFTVVADPPAIPMIIATTTTDEITGLPQIELIVNGEDNQLTANQASLESGVTTGWTAGSNTTIAASTDWAQDGDYSLELIATSAGAVSANTPTGTSGVVCSPGQVVRAMSSAHSTTTVRACTVAIVFYNASGSVLSTSTSTSVNSTLTGNGGKAFISATAPALTASMTIFVNGAALSTSEHLYFDVMLLGPGSSTVWSAGGFVGITYASITRSDGVLVRGAGWEGTLALGANQTGTVYDTETDAGTVYTYTAQVVATVSGNILTSAASAASAGVTLDTDGYWWLFDPMQPEAICVRFVMKSNWQPAVKELGATYEPIGSDVMIKSSAGTLGVGGIIALYVGDTLANNLAAETLIQQTQGLCFVTPTRGIYYVMSDPATPQKGNVTPWWEVDQPQSEWQFTVVETSRP
jgi:hypothetical protein